MEGNILNMVPAFFHVLSNYGESVLELMRKWIFVPCKYLENKIKSNLWFNIQDTKNFHQKMPKNLSVLK